MNQNLTDITVVLDRSGSMQSIRGDMEGGLNSFIDQQKTLPGEVIKTVVGLDGVPIVWGYTNFPNRDFKFKQMDIRIPKNAKKPTNEVNEF